MKRVVHHSRGQCVETSEVRQNTPVPLWTEWNNRSLQREIEWKLSLPAWLNLILDTSTTYVSMMLSCGKNQWATSCSPMEGASWKRFRYFCSSSVTWGMSRLSIGRRPGVLVLFKGCKRQETEVHLRSCHEKELLTKKIRLKCLHLVVYRASWFFAGSCFCWGGRI